MSFKSTLRRLGESLAAGRRGRPTKAARPRLALEALEDRCVPATLKLAGGLVTYDAGAGVANNLSISLSGVTYTFKDTAEPIVVVGIPGATGSGTNTVTIPAAQVPPAGMLINLGDKADVLSVESTANAIAVKGGADNDTIDVGKFSGGALSGIQAAVTVDGEAGTDTLRVNDPASAVGRTYTVTAAKVTPEGGFDVSYVGTENLAVTAGRFADTFTVRGTAAGTTTTLDAATGADTFNVGSTANTLDDIKGPLALNGGPGTPFPFFRPDTMNLFDQGGGVARTYILKAGSVDRAGVATISYSEVERVALNAGDFADSAVVQGTSAPVTLNMGGGNDTVILGNASNSLDAINSLVTVNGQAGKDTVVLNDQGDGNANSYLVTSTDVTRDGTMVLSYATAEGLILNAGNFADSAQVDSTLAATPVALKMGGGDDTVNVGANLSTNGFRTLRLIQGALTVDGQAGSDRLTLDDGDATFGIVYTVTATAVSRDGAAPVAYTGLENLTVNSAAQLNLTDSVINTFRVKSTSAATTLNGGSLRRDSFVVGNDSNSLDDIRGALTVNGAAGVASGSDEFALILNDQGDADANTYAITALGVTRSGAAPITYGNPIVVSSSILILNAGAANDTVTVTSTSATVPVRLNMGPGNDTVTVGGGFNGLNLIASPVTVNGNAGADSVVLNDVAGFFGLGSNNYLVTSSDVIRNGREILNYGTDESLTLNAGLGNDTITVTTTLATTPVVVRAGLGDDTFKLGGTNASTLLGAVTLDGQGGTDELDYSAYTVGVRVNLAAGTATGAAGGVSNIENVTGGSANDIIVGNDLVNSLKGGFGRDILIGRVGADQLFGQADDDILIGGSTVHDLNAAALESIMREWSRTDLVGTAQSQYTTRINHLLGVQSGGLNGATTLDLSKVIDDGATDGLNGGLDLDWFFKLGADVLVTPGATERVN